MSVTLYCTPAERLLLERLSPDLRNGFSLQEEMEVPPDTPAKQLTRARLLTLYQNPLLRYIDASQKLDGSSLPHIPFEDFSQQEILEVLFMVGPSAISLLVEEVLLHIHTKKELRNLALVTTIRHHLIQSLHCHLSS